MDRQVAKLRRALQMGRPSPGDDISTFVHEGIRALIFDVDGTLYRRHLLKWRLLARFAMAHLTAPLTSLRVLRALNSYRRALEILRASQRSPCNIYDAQIGLACAATGFEVDFVRGCVDCWMHQHPLQVLNRCLDRHLVSLLKVSRERGLRLGAFSDYPAAEKLAALGLDSYFDAVVCAGDPQVQKLKPDPRGLEVTLEKLGISKDHAVYIGDRPEIDAAAAQQLGMRCFILGANKSDCLRWGCTSFSRFRELTLQLSPSRYA